ncbi:MAG: hypothetical protein LBV06_01475 [Propionibacteriaceae bacterium]|jgi:N,N'-diacetylchitobiose phosphorylase|nr:hypothetical protein [Propionibacteriaceae bacterium]
MKYGYFDQSRDEYVIDRVDVPASWINYIGVENWCTVINQNAGGYSFYRSSQQGRVTRFRPNGVPLDRPGHYLYLRDDDSEDYWSCSWQPVGKPLDQATYRARHGLSYSIFECDYAGISASQRVFVPRGDDVELWDVTLTNTSDRPRQISTFGYVEFSFHSVQIDNENFQMSLYASGSDYAEGVIEYDFYYEPWTYHYFTSTTAPDGFDSMRDSFIGPYRTETNPIAVEQGFCSGSAATTQNHCGALQHRISLAPGQSVRLVYLLGYGNRSVAQQVKAKYADPAQVDAAIEDLASYWRAKKSVFACDTPSEAMNTLLNSWTLLQAETCVVWSRFASFVEVGGRVGLGYRDTAQDIMSVVHTNPDKVKQRIMELLHGQMSPGYGLHLFDPSLFAENRRQDIPVGVKLPTVVPGRAADLVHGLDDACSDDHLWLVPSVVEYIVETGQVDLLDTVAPFADSELGEDERVRVLGEGYAARFDQAPATVLDHLMRALEFSAEQVGDNGIAKGLRADWNDCLNLGGGQTSLVSFLHVWAAKSLRGLLAGLTADQLDPGRSARLISRLDEMIEVVTEAVNRELWDGRWYIRGYTRDGVKIGSQESTEGKIFLEHMPWAVIAGVADRGHGLSSMDAVDEYLASEYGTHLCWPSYTTVDDTIGYVTRVYPGVKENGAIFSHPNAWPIMAEAMLGRGDRAMRFYDSMAPSRQNDIAEIRGAEPYVYAQFIYGRDHEFYGRAQNPWLTGTAGWMYTAATKHILGVRPTPAGLVIDPCVPSDWDGFTVTRSWRGATYRITVTNSDHVFAGVKSVVVNGSPIEVAQGETRQIALIPTADADQVVDVTIQLG